METTDLVELEELKRRLLEPISARVSAPTNPDGPDAVAAITALQARVEKLEGENKRLQEGLGRTRQQLKQRGRNLLEEEATAVLRCFGPQWEPLRVIASRSGIYSASQMASRARNLERRGLIESKWCGAERTSSYKLWRSLGRPVPVHASGPSAALAEGGQDGND